MKNSILLKVFVCALCCPVPFFMAFAERPNVVFLLSDDHGWKDYGFMGHAHVQTPNLDQLASEGLIYERG